MVLFEWVKVSGLDHVYRCRRATCHHPHLISGDYPLLVPKRHVFPCLPSPTSQTVTPMTSSQIRAIWRPPRLPTMLLEDKTHHQSWEAVRKLGQRLFMFSPQKWQTSKTYSTYLFICLSLIVSVFQENYYSYLIRSCWFREESFTSMLCNYL